MKKTVILFLWTILMPIASYAQFDRTLSLKFDESNFQIEEFEGLSYIQSKGLTTVFESDTISPALPYVCLNVTSFVIHIHCNKSLNLICKVL